MSLSSYGMKAGMTAAALAETADFYRIDVIAEARRNGNAYRTRPVHDADVDRPVHGEPGASLDAVAPLRGA